MTAHDGYERYYAEKLWALVPEVYRFSDDQGVLRAFIEAVGTQAADLRRGVDRLWDDQSIETCDDDVVPLIGDLVATRLVSALDARARRVDVARTIRYRRHRGTPHLLEQLARELSGWDAVLEEAFKRVARARHGLDAPVEDTRGRFSHTPRGGTADLRSPLAAKLRGGAFDEYAHTVDVRRQRGRDGLYNLRKLNFRLYRLRTYEIGQTDLVALADSGLPTWTVDPSGRDIALFMAGREDLSLVDPSRDTRACAQPAPWDVRDRMTCRLFNHAEYLLAPTEVEAFLTEHEAELQAGEADAIRALAGIRFASKARLLAYLAGGGVVLTPEPLWLLPLLFAAIVEESGRPKLYEDSLWLGVAGDAGPLPGERVLAGDLSARNVHPEPTDPGVRMLVDPALGRLARVPSDAADAPVSLKYVVGFSANIGANTYSGRSPLLDVNQLTGGGTVTPAVGTTLVTFADERTYTLDFSSDFSRAVTQLTLQASDRRRPYVLLKDSETGASFSPTPRASDDEVRRLVIDGLWLGGTDGVVGHTYDLNLRRATGSARANDVASFDWDEVIVRNATLDPGGKRADGGAIKPVRLLISGRIKCLVIERSIIGPIEVVQSDEPADSGLVETLVIRDSIVDAGQARNFALINAAGDTKIVRSTVIGDIRVERLFASELLVLGGVRVADNQSGCFRFSAASSQLLTLMNPDHPVETDSLFPPRYHSLPDGDQTSFTIEAHFFHSLRFGDPDYLQLSESCPLELREGGEDRREMGVFASERARIKLASIDAKIDEYKPVGLIAQYLFET